MTPVGRRGAWGNSRTGASPLPGIAVTLITAFLYEEALAVFGVSGVSTFLRAHGRYKGDGGRGKSDCENFLHGLILSAAA
jgi:hypothetical protein